MHSKGLRRAHFSLKKTQLNSHNPPVINKYFQALCLRLKPCWSPGLITRGQETPRYCLSSGSGSIPFYPTQTCHKIHTHFSICLNSFLSFLESLGKRTQSYFRGTLNYNTKKITTLESPRTADIKVLRAESIFPVG